MEHLMARIQKNEAHTIIDRLSNDAEWEDLMYEIYVREKVERGLTAVREGKTISHEQALASMRNHAD